VQWTPVVAAAGGTVSRESGADVVVSLADEADDKGKAARKSKVRTCGGGNGSTLFHG
jgi:hypothetical protein